MHDSSLSAAQHREPVEALALSHVLPHDMLPIEECLGRRLAVSVFSLIPLSPSTNSAVDGSTVYREDLEGEGPWILPVVGDIPVGDTRENHPEKRQAWRIMTDAPIPEDTDTVVKAKHTDHTVGIARTPDSVEIRVTPKLGASVRVVGEAFKASSPILKAGHILDGATLSATASAGHGILTTLPRPHVIVVSTDTELKHAGEVLERGQIPDSNGILLRGLVGEAGGQVATHLRTGDILTELRRALDEASKADLVLTAGGVLAGAFEVVRLTLGTDASFHHVAQQPDGPQGVGSTQVSVGDHETPVICLPGNPVSVFMTFHMYVASALAIMSGLAAPEHGGTVPSDVIARAHVGWDCPSGKTQLIPLRPVDVPGGEIGARWMEPMHPLGSKLHLVASPANARAIGMVTPDVGVVEPGQELAVVPLTG